MTPISDSTTEKDNTSVLAINVGQPRPLPGQKHEVLSGIMKHPVSTPVFLSFTGMTGDAQADLVHHGVRIRQFVYTITAIMLHLNS